ncbi:MAG TPA: hypothetical protein VIK41_26075 [Gemmatimonadaceae bacterium]
MPDDFSPNVAAIAGNIPIALLPVRIETRFFNSAAELRVRIFPDQVHVDAHEPELTVGERDLGIAYWQARFAAPDPNTRASSPWATLAGIVGPARAAWIAAALTPTNIAQLGQPVTPVFPAAPARAAEWSRAARAVALPERWVVIGMRDGREIFRKWSATISDVLDLTPAPDDPTPIPDDTLPLQPSARWLVDFDEAEKKGMAVRIGAADLARGMALGGGLDRLFVLGVDWTVAPEKAAETLRRLFASHVYTDGLSAIEPGTPTNVTAAARPGARPSDAALTSALDPEARPMAAKVGGGGAADRLYRALGLTIRGDDALVAIPGSSAREQDVATHLANVIWEATLGGYVTDFLNPLFPDALTKQLRDHVRQYVFAGGPYTAIRIGKQPYGVLPVVAPGRLTSRADAPFESGLAVWLGKLRPFWQAGTGRVPRLGMSSDLDADLTAVLQTTPQSQTFRYRSILGALAVNATIGLARHAAAQDQITEIVGSHLDWPQRPDIAGFTTHPIDRPLRVPLVDPKPIVPGAPLSVTYLQDIATLARTSGTYDAIKAREDASTLLEALVAHATARELHRADIITIDKHRLAAGAIKTAPLVGLMQASEYVGIETATRPDATAGVLVTSPWEASRVVIPTVTKSLTVRQFVTAAVNRGVRTPADYQALGDMLASLDVIATKPADQLERVFRGVLDLYAYRLDAWYTSLATRRLTALRSATPAGVHIGAYGWVDDVRPATAPTSEGYIHTPSLAQATTAAVLRSGHLAHNDAEHKALNLDLSSARVRTALRLLDGIDQGQPLAALLGYRFERAIRARSLTLARFILPFRRLAPLRSNVAPPAPATASENLAARDVVDGVTLLERWANERSTLLATLVPVPSPAEQTMLAEELDRLADIYDAVADVMVAEAVHQNVRGNNERAGAVIAALDRQDRPPEMEFVRTPRTGTSFTHRLLVLIGDETLPPSWATIPLDPRASVEPRLNAWIARLIGDPKRVKFAATVTTSTQKLALTLDQLGLSPLSLVMASQAAGKDSPSELEERLVHRFASMVNAPKPNSELTLLDEPPAGSKPTIIGLGAFRALAYWIYTLITEQHSANANDLALPQDPQNDGLDHAQLGGRADALVTSYASAIATLDAAIGASTPIAKALRDALFGAAAFGLRSAVPGPPPLGSAAAADADELLGQARVVVAEMRAAAARERDLVTSFGNPPAATADERVRHHTSRIGTLVGEHFPVLACFSVPTGGRAAELTASNAARATLLAKDDFAPSVWMDRMALVRPGVDRLARVSSAAELLGSDASARDLIVAQLPHTPKDRWIALPFDGAVPTAELAIVACWSGAVSFTAPLAGLFCDGWHETVPNADETTGVAFHFDAPGARPPQAIVLAVPPAADTPAWSVDTILDTVVEAHDLAKIRAVGPRQLEWLGTLLPAIYLPDSFSPDVPVVKVAGLAAKYSAANAATATILGKA